MKSLPIVLLFFFSLAQAHADSCPSTVRFVSLCEPYQGTQQILSAVDYQAMGEVGPAVAKDVMSVSSLLTLSKSVWSFKPTLSQLRSKYFIPILRVIEGLKSLEAADRSNHAEYLLKTQAVYTDLVLTAVDTTLKSYKVAPEVLDSARKVGFAWVMASTSDPVPHPTWTANLMNKFSQVASDILFNDSKTPLDQRLASLSSMEGELRNAVALSCQESAADQECLAFAAR